MYLLCSSSSICILEIMRNTLEKKTILLLFFCESEPQWTILAIDSLLTVLYLGIKHGNRMETKYSNLFKQHASRVLSKDGCSV